MTEWFINNIDKWLPAAFGLVGVLVGGLLPIITSTITENKKRTRDAQSVAALIYSEISGSLRVIDVRNYLGEVTAIIKRLEQDSQKRCSYSIDISPDHMKIFSSTLDRLGLIQPDLLIHITGFYHNVEAVAVDVRKGGLLERETHGLKPFLELHLLLQKITTEGPALLSKLKKEYNLKI